MDIFKRPVTILIVVIAIIIALIWSYINNLSEKKKAAEEAARIEAETKSQMIDLSNIDPAEYDNVVKTEYASAKEKAESINPNFKLAAIQVSMPSLSLNSGETRYIFVNDEDKINNWTISFSQSTGNYLRAIIPKDDYMGNPAIMDTTLWKFNFATAFQIADKNGGSDWRNKNSLNNIELTLKHNNDKSRLVWIVKYSGNNSEFIKYIDSSSGNIVE